VWWSYYKHGAANSDILPAKKVMVCALNDARCIMASPNSLVSKYAHIETEQNGDGPKPKLCNCRFLLYRGEKEIVLGFAYFSQPLIQNASGQRASNIITTYFLLVIFFYISRDGTNIRFSDYYVDSMITYKWSSKWKLRGKRCYYNNYKSELSVSLV